MLHFFTSIPLVFLPSQPFDVDVEWFTLASRLFTLSLEKSLLFYELLPLSSFVNEIGSTVLVLDLPFSPPPPPPLFFNLCVRMSQQALFLNILC